jgi:hypothetical protein
VPPELQGVVGYLQDTGRSERERKGDQSARESREECERENERWMAAIDESFSHRLWGRVREIEKKDKSLTSAVVNIFFHWMARERR